MPLYLIWLRRCTSARAYAGLLAVTIVLIHSRMGWQHEWGWATSWAASTTWALGPLAAGLVAHDRARHLAPTLADLGSTTPRSSSSVLALVLASWSWYLLAWLAGVGYVAVWVLVNGSAGTPDWWSLAQGPVVLLAAASLGALCGSLLPNLAAGPVAAASLFMLGLVGESLGLRGLLVAGGSTGTLLAMQQITSIALAVLIAQGTLASTCLLWTVARTRSSRLLYGIALASTLAVLAAVGLARDAVVSSDGNLYEASTAPTICVGTGVQVCGPKPARPLLTMAQSDLSTAIHHLGGSGIDWQRRYVFAFTEDVPADSGQLSLQPEGITHGHLSQDDLMSTLLTPRPCEAYFSGPTAVDLIDQASVVRDWVHQHLRSPDGTPAPPQVRESYRAISECEPFRPGRDR